jgi:hypothetical protein
MEDPEPEDECDNEIDEKDNLLLDRPDKEIH